MKIDNNLVLKLEKLAKLRLSADERERLSSDLNNILQMIETLEQLDTEGIEPLVYVNDELNKLRNDETKSHLSQTQALSNAPAQDGSHFLVPKML